MRLSSPGDARTILDYPRAISLRKNKMDIVKYETDGYALCEIESREKKMEERRRNQELHHHKHIWTKEPYGGRYINTAANRVCDTLVEDPTGRPLAVPTGYERSKRGPTTNFVGNHMTQGAIDLVQMELQPAVRDLKMLELRPQAPVEALCTADPCALTVDGPQMLPVQQYTWQDKGNHILLQITAQHHVAGSTNVSFRPHKFHVQYMEQAGAEDFAACHRALSVNPLFAEVLPENCHLSVDEESLPASAAADSTALVTTSQLCKKLSIFLAKADPEITWDRLASELQPIRYEVDARRKDARLALMRKALRAQRRSQVEGPVKPHRHAAQEPLQLCY